MKNYMTPLNRFLIDLVKLKVKRAKENNIIWVEDTPCGCDRDAFTKDGWKDPKVHGCLNEDGSFRDNYDYV